MLWCYFWWKILFNFHHLSCSGQSVKDIRNSKILQFIDRNYVPRIIAVKMIETRFAKLTVPGWGQMKFMKWAIGSNYVNPQTWKYKRIKQIYENISIKLVCVYNQVMIGTTCPSFRMVSKQKTASVNWLHQFQSRSFHSPRLKLNPTLL